MPIHPERIWKHYMCPSAEAALFTNGAAISVRIGLVSENQHRTGHAGYPIGRPLLTCGVSL
jgi:hypothetical protein